VLSDDVTRKVRALLERANHPGTPQAEAEAALAMAYRLMAKYDLDERLLAQQPDSKRTCLQKKGAVFSPMRRLWDLEFAFQGFGFRRVVFV
jgi:hypothetical protein